MADATQKPIALVAEDEPQVARLLKAVLANTHDVHMHDNGEDALQEAQALRQAGTPPGVLVTDQGLAKTMKGLELIDQVRALFPAVPVVMVSGTQDPGLAAEVANRKGAFVAKPITPLAKFTQGINQAYANMGLSSPAAGTSPGLSP